MLRAQHWGPVRRPVREEARSRALLYFAALWMRQSPVRKHAHLQLEGILAVRMHMRSLCLQG